MIAAQSQSEGANASPVPVPLAPPVRTSADDAPRRLLAVDDNAAIHEDYRKLLCPRRLDDLDDLEAELLGSPTTPAPARGPEYDLTHAHQGLEAVELADAALAEGRPFALALVDMRMPPGIDGLETVTRLWALDPRMEIVLCTAYSDHSWQDLLQRLGYSDRLHVLRKPFEPIELTQAVLALTEKWKLQRQAEAFQASLERRVEERTQQLEAETRQRLELETQLRHAQKLEAVGQLAAGIAHEINTPIQFIGDSVHFAKDAFGQVDQVLTEGMRLVASLEQGRIDGEVLATYREAQQEADLEFLHEELPDAFERALEGIARVSEIVRAMRGFVRQDAGALEPADINDGIRSTLIVARNEYKLAAEVETDLADLPTVRCRVSDLNQVFLNLVVNAAHAIEERMGASRVRGHIRITTRVDGDHVAVSVADDGAGIPEAVRNRIFDPFFTTKPVGKGTGQGLAISYGIVVEGHGGEIGCESVEGQGTTMTIRLPVAGPTSEGSGRHEAGR